MKHVVLSVLALFMVPSLVACANGGDSHPQEQDPVAFVGSTQTKTCIAGLRKLGIIGEDQEVYVYTDNARIDQLQAEFPEAYVTTMSALSTVCRKNGFSVPST